MRMIENACNVGILDVNSLLLDTLGLITTIPQYVGTDPLNGNIVLRHEDLMTAMANKHKHTSKKTTSQLLDLLSMTQTRLMYIIVTPKFNLLTKN